MEYLEQKIRQAYDLGSRYIHYPSALAGAAVMGTAVYLANYSGSHDVMDPLIAASKQAAYTFFAAGLITRSCEYLAINIKRKFLALATAIIIPVAVTSGLTYLIHTNTEHRERTTATVAAAVLPWTAYRSIVARRKKEKAA